MTRPLNAVLAESGSVLVALRRALSGDGPAILPHPAPSSVAGSLSSTVPQRVALVVETSGSTGRPKRVMLSANALLASAAASDTALGGPGQWMLAVPVHYIAGINVLVRSIAAEVDPVVMAPNRSFTPEGFLAAAGEFTYPRRFVSLVPAQLRRLLESPDAVAALHGFARVLVGGQAMPSDLREQVAELGLPVTRTYGSSETSGGCVYDGEPIGDTRVRVVGGRIELGGSVLAEGYLDDPRRTAFSFPEEGGERWYRTDDVGEFVDGVLRVRGRVDDVIVSGGVKVLLSEVEDVVRSLPGLASAVVAGAPHPEWGEAPVVVSPVAADLEAVRGAVVARLGRAAAPARILLVDRVPELPGGKPDRVAIAALVLR